MNTVKVFSLVDEREVMALSKQKRETIVTLHELGFSNRAIGSAVRCSHTAVSDILSAELGDDLTSSKGSIGMANFKNATLASLAIEIEDTRDKIAALNSLDTGSGESKEAVRPVMSDVQFEKQFGNVTSD